MKTKHKKVLLSGLLIFALFAVPVLIFGEGVESPEYSMGDNILTDDGLTAPVENCDPLTVANGVVAAYPDCTITCNSGYTLSGNACIVTTPPGGPGGGGSTTPRPGDYTTQSGCEGANFYWYDGACHSTAKVVIDEDDTTETTAPIEGTKGYYQGQEEDLEEQLREQKAKKSRVENLNGAVLVLLNHVEGTDKEDDYKDALLAILSSIESLMSGIEGEIENLEELLGVVRDKIKSFNQKERVDALERMVVGLLNAIDKTEENQAKITALEAVLDTIRGIKTNIEAKLN
jgi:hypothetical protein